MFFCKQLKAGTPYGDISGVFFSWPALYASIALLVIGVLLGATLWHSFGPSLPNLEVLRRTPELSQPLIAAPTKPNAPDLLQSSLRPATETANLNKENSR